MTDVNYGDFKLWLIQGNEEAAKPNGNGETDWLVQYAKANGYI